MFIKRLPFSAAILLALVSAGCAHPAHPPATTQTSIAPSNPDLHTKIAFDPQGPIFGSVNPTPHAEGDPHPAIPYLVRLNVYQITVPSRSVSKNEEFWKHVDEGPRALDPGTHDLLDRNGIRVGIAPQADWAYFRSILMRHRAVTQVSTAQGERPTPMPISLKPEQQTQYLFWYDGDGEGSLCGQNYEDCEDFFEIRFLPTPRRDGDVTLSLVPMLRATRRRIEYTLREQEVIHLKEIYPEYRFELGLKTIIPYDSFMVIAPSPMAHKAPILGKSFLLQDGKGEQLETVLLISPQAFRLDEPATTRSSK